MDVNFIHCQILPVHPDIIKDLPPEMLDELNDHSFLVKEGWRLILATRPPNDEEIVKAWSDLKTIKEQDGGA